MLRASALPDNRLSGLQNTVELQQLCDSLGRGDGSPRRRFSTETTIDSGISYMADSRKQQCLLHGQESQSWA